jgi:uncharacterized protein (DUF736 family)
MIIGHFTYDLDHDTYADEITTLTLQRSNVVFRPTAKSGDREPDYRVVQERDGAMVEFGAAWKRGSDRRGAFLSVVLDDPALLSSLNAALFHSDPDKRATLVWQRPTRKTPATEAEATNARPRKPSAARNSRVA